jgi:hypothetical protein
MYSSISEAETGRRETERAAPSASTAAEPASAPDKTPKSGWGTEAPAAAAKPGAPESTVAEYTPDEASSSAASARRRAEEDEDEALVQEVAAPPKPAAKPVVSIRELEKETRFSLPAPPDPEVDLSVLSATLRPPGLVTESDEQWDVEGMLVRLTGEILAEQELEEQTREAKELAEAEQKKLAAATPAPQPVVTVSLTGVGSVEKK